MTTVNFAEAAQWFTRRGGGKDEVLRVLGDLLFPLTPFDADLAVRVALLEPLTQPKGLGLGDRACLALAQRLGVPALTGDRKWAEIADAVGVKVELIR